MTKMLIVGDQHFRFEIPYENTIEDKRAKEKESVISTIHKASSDCDYVVLLGDNLNTRHNHSHVLKEFISFLNGFGDKNIYILVGNHERYGESTALDFLKEINIKNITIIDSGPEKYTIDGKECVFVPYMSPHIMNVDSVQEASEKLTEKLPDGDIAFFHQFITLHDSVERSQEMYNEIVLDGNMLSEKYTEVFDGHIHKPSDILPNVHIVGSVFTHEVMETEKSIMKVTISEKNDVFVTEVIKLPVRPIFKIHDDISALEELPDYSIVKYISGENTKKSGIDINEKMDRFDGKIIISDNKNTREVSKKIGDVDLSFDNLIKLYAETNGIEEDKLKTAINIIEQI